MSRGESQLLLGEWACLGIVAMAPTHGFAVAQRLRPEGDIGRVWSLSRALTYRALDQLVARGHLVTAGSEPGIAGGQRTVLSVTPQGRTLLERWLVEPVRHLRDLRSELLLKLLLCDELGIDPTLLLTRQREVVQPMADALVAPSTDDVVAVWRHEASQAAVRFVDRLLQG